MEKPAYPSAPEVEEDSRMQTYEIPLVPGPVCIHEQVLAAYQVNYGSADLEPEFLDLYADTQAHLQQIMGTRHQIVLMSGEGMGALWGALKSTIAAGDRVLAVATGVFGYGIGDMARAIGAKVETVGFEYDEAATNLERVEEAIQRFQPKMVTLVHCETPSGIINPAAEVGALVNEHNVPLYYVDTVASVGGMRIKADEWHMDLCLGGTQKALSSLSDLGIVAVSGQAWEIIKEVGYQGYDALAPFDTALADAYFPYTPNWHAVAGLHTACALLLDEGLEAVFERHARVAAYCRQRVKQIGLSLFPRDPATSAPTVTAVKVPHGANWAQLDTALRRRGMVVGGSYGPLAGQVFRIGHMGCQADMELIERGMNVLAEVVDELGAPDTP
jgi:aspartate aminotransferase-like enzyme